MFTSRKTKIAAAFTAGAAAVRRPRRESLVSPRNRVRCDALFVALITA